MFSIITPNSVLYCFCHSFHTRENRGFDTVKSTMKYVPQHYILFPLLTVKNSRLFWYALLESLGVVGMAMYVALIVHLQSLDSHTAATVFRYISCRHSSQKQAESTKCNLLPGYHSSPFTFATHRASNTSDNSYSICRYVYKMGLFVKCSSAHIALSPVVFSSLDLHMHALRPGQLVITYTVDHQNWIRNTQLDEASGGIPNLLRLMPLPLFLTPVHASAGSK